MKVMTIMGTRPEVIRLSRVMALLDEYTEHVMVHTGQNYDYELNQVLFEDLELRAPDFVFDIDTSTVGTVYGSVLARSEEVLRSEAPDAVLILGDTNSSIACIIARRLKIPVFHMEAGNRSFDWEVPEETNRRIADHISNYNLVYTEHARRNLLAEGIHPERIYLTGSPMREVLDHYRPRIDASAVLEDQDLVPGEYLLASVHREENVDRPERLKRVLESLDALGKEHGIPVLVSTHPRTRMRLTELGDEFTSDAIRWHKPFGFLDYNKLQMHARCVISDSGTIGEESAILGFPAVTPRNSMERPEALDAGTLTISGLQPESVVRSVGQAILLAVDRKPHLPVEYTITDTSVRVLRLITGKSMTPQRF
ncbi:MAG: UDP-N-acetylglucosamine 2-epimerase (non-hydrolyzing) [Acidimicrobiia bacterium]|nr:UDP-N-acetylglucosamine 2-epimerase (non-hydrolyzing) [Acidimicrobiia bacterium]